MFGSDFPMPSEEFIGTDIEYRCPYRTKCCTKAKCFAAATPEPLQEDAILNVSCRLMGGKKIPVFASAARVYNKN